MVGVSSAFPWWQEFPETARSSTRQQYAPEYLPGGSKRDADLGRRHRRLVRGSGVRRRRRERRVAPGAIVTRADVIRGLSLIQNSTNGGYTPPVSRQRQDPEQAGPCFWLYHVENARYVSTNGLGTSCEPASDLG